MVDPNLHGSKALSFPGRKPPRSRLHAGRIFRDDRARADDPSRELGMAARVVAVDAAAEHGEALAQVNVRDLMSER
jgi:hypothetical protein